jgi:hypothetical protein
LFLACQHLSSGTDVQECEDQSWFKVRVVPVFHFDVRYLHIPQVKGHWYKGFGLGGQKWALTQLKHCNLLLLSPSSSITSGYRFAFVTHVSDKPTNTTSNYKFVLKIDNVCVL